MRKLLLALTGALLVPSFAFADFHGRPNHFGKPFAKKHSRPCDNDPGPRPGGYNYHRHNFAPMKWKGNNAFWYGIKSGRLSNNEVRDLRRDQFELQRKERTYWSDGYLSRNEREDLKDTRQDFYDDLRHELKDGERRW